MRFPRPYRRVFAAVVAALLLGACGSAWAKPHAKRVARDEVMDLENEWVKVQVANDVSGMDKLLSPDFLGITGYGEVVTKAQQLERMRNRMFVIHTMEISDVRVKLLGQHAAIVTSLAQLNATMDGHPVVGSFRYTHVYQKLPNGMWSITNFEATRALAGNRHGAQGAQAPDAVTPQQ